MKFISKVTTMGGRLFIQIPKDVYEEAEPLKGKHIKVEVDEIKI